MITISVAAAPDEPDTVISLRESEDQGRQVLFVVIGRGAIRPTPEKDRLIERLSRDIGRSNRRTYLMHLGASKPAIPIGPTDLHGEAASQRDAIANFFREAATLQGGFGSWWEESFAQIRELMNGYPASVTIALIQGNAAKPPLEWKEADVNAWFANRQKTWGQGDDKLLIISPDAATTGFSSGPFMRTVELKDFVDQTPAGSGAVPNHIQIEVTRDGEKDIGKPDLLMPGMTMPTEFQGTCVISIPYNALRGHGAIDVVRVRGVAPSEIQASLVPP